MAGLQSLLYEPRKTQAGPIPHIRGFPVPLSPILPAGETDGAKGLYIPDGYRNLCDMEYKKLIKMLNGRQEKYHIERVKNFTVIVTGYDVT